MITNTVSVVAMVAAVLASKRWTVRQHEEGEASAAPADLVVSDPSGKVYLIGLKGGEEPMHFATIAQVERSARLLSEQEGETVTPVLLTSQDVRPSISQIAGDVGVQLVEAASDQEAAESVVQFLQATQ